MNGRKILHFITLTAWHTIVVFFLVGLILLKHDPAVADDGGNDFTAIKIQAEDYDKGGQNVAYFDKTPGNNGGQYRTDDVDIWKYGPIDFYTGANATGEWLNCTIDVPYNGNYRLDIRVATPNSNRRVHLEFDGVDATGSWTVPNTGWWTTFETLSTNVALSAGRQVMRLVIDYGGMNIDLMSLTYIESFEQVAAPTIEPDGGKFVDPVEVTLTTSTDDATIFYTIDGSDPDDSPTRIEYIWPFTLTQITTVRAYAVKAGWIDSEEVIADFTKEKTPVIIIQTEDYDQGGQGTAYYDTTSGNAGGQYRSDDVDIWRFGLNLYYTGANAAGEWQQYAIDVPVSGVYRLKIRLASPYSGRRLHIEFDGVNRTGPITLPNTGWWTTWQTFEAHVKLSAGYQIMRLVIDSGGFNLDWIELEYLFIEKDCGNAIIMNGQDLKALSGCTSIGHLVISNSDLRDLEGLNCLTTISNGSYGLLIEDNKNLKNLQGLNSLTAVSASGDYEDFLGVSIHSNPSLTSLEGLDSLTTVLDTLSIGSNDRLVTMEGLKELSNVGCNLNISHNSSLINLMGLNDLMQVGRELHIMENDSLLNLEGLNNLHYVGATRKFYCDEQYECISAYIIIEGNDSLMNLEGLSSLSGIYGDLLIIDNDSLESLAGLNAQGTEFESPISIRGNDNLSSLGLNNLTNIGRLEIRDNANLVNLEGLNNLTDMGSLDIRDSPNLMSLEGLRNISAVHGDLTIVNNDSLSSLEGLNELISVGIYDEENPVGYGSLSIKENDALTDLSLDSLRKIWLDFDICNNTMLDQSQVESLRDQVLSRDGIEGYINIGPNCD